MTSPTIAARVLEELRRSGLPLDDDELPRRLSVRPRQTINQVCRRLERSGHLRRCAGPEGKIVNDVRPSSAAQSPRASPAIAVRGREAGLLAAADAPSPGSGQAWPGRPVTLADLRQVGFRHLELWMVTMGRLPGSGGARGGQRYGRPRHAGETRQRVSILIAEQLRSGRAWYGTGFARFPQRRSAPRKNGSSPAGTCARRAGISAYRKGTRKSASASRISGLAWAWR